MKKINLLKVNAIKCPKCGDTIFSRVRHDFRKCTCGEVFIDGGFDYIRIGFNSYKPEVFMLKIKQTKSHLYNDWNCHGNKFGLIPDPSFAS